MPSFVAAILRFLRDLLGWHRDEPLPAPPAPVPSDWAACVRWVLDREGGYVNDINDPGGPTNMGITLPTLSKWLGRQAFTTDVRNLDEATATAIYEKDYWVANRCDEMPPGVNLVMFDCIVMTGGYTPARWLQAAVGAQQDGIIGEATIAATKRSDAATVVKMVSEARMNYYKSLSTWAVFGAGWTNRVLETQTQALSMVARD